MEAIITIVGFLGAGKTTLLKEITKRFIAQGWNPYLILNDYENAHLDVQEFKSSLDPKSILPLNGSCICCSGINELRDYVNRIPERENGITLIEANGTSDSVSLMGFLGVGIVERFLPPIQISVVDAKNWQKRDEHNELEASQIQISSLIILSHTDEIDDERKSFVIRDIARFNPSAKIIEFDQLDISFLSSLKPSKNKTSQLDHFKSHWSSSSVELPSLPDEDCIHAICNELPDTILRIKGCTKIGNDEHYTYFERIPDGTVNIRPFYGEPSTGPKLLCVGIGSSIPRLENAIENSLLQS